MARRDQLASAGMGIAMAGSVTGDTNTGLTAAGSTQATALVLAAVNNFIATAAASTGVLLPVGQPGDVIFVYNGGANTVTVYPPVGGTINNLSANTGLAVATLKSGFYVYSGGLTVASLLSA